MTPRVEDAIEPPIRYGIPRPSSADASCLSVVANGLIIGQGVAAIGFDEEFVSESHSCKAEQDFVFVGLRIALTQARLGELSYQRRRLEGVLQFLRGRHAALQIDEYLPRFGRCVCGAHDYVLIIAGYNAYMSGVEEIERAIQELSDDEFARIAQRVHELEQERWDAEMDRDAVAGKFDSLIAEARKERAQGYSGKLKHALPMQETCVSLRAVRGVAASKATT